MRSINDDPQIRPRESGVQHEPRLLLCRPRWGLNDTLCEVERCWRYAESAGRKLLVDASRSGLHDNFWHYFLPNARNAMTVTMQQSYGDLDTLSALPASIANRVSTYEATYDTKIKNFAESQSRECLTFDFSLLHAEIQLLVHEQCWSGDFRSPECLARLHFTPICQSTINARMQRLQNVPYDAIHIRNTDYTTNLDHLFTELAKMDLEENLLVCSDNYQTIEQFRARFGTSHNVVRLSEFEDNFGEPLHRSARENQFQTNIDVLADLVGLAFSRKLIFANVRESGRSSGFSLLARALHEHRDIAFGLMGS